VSGVEKFLFLRSEEFLGCFVNNGGFGGEAGRLQATIVEKLDPVVRGSGSLRDIFGWLVPLEPASFGENLGGLSHHCWAGVETLSNGRPQAAVVVESFAVKQDSE
jgi:hypothetical protein